MAGELSRMKVLGWETNSAGRRKTRTRVGRGEGSGKGTTAGRGTKGQQSRSGYSRKVGFEGGQMPLHRRLPKRGFRNVFAKDIEVLNLGQLSRFEAGQDITPQLLKQTGVISRIGKHGVKILAGGDIAVALHIKQGILLSASAANKILPAGGTVEQHPPTDSHSER